MQLSTSTVFVMVQHGLQPIAGPSPPTSIFGSEGNADLRVCCSRLSVQRGWWRYTELSTYGTSQQPQTARQNQHGCMNIEDFLRSRSGAATTQTLLTAGFTRRMLANAVRDGRVTRLHRGVYTSKESDPDVVAAFRSDGLITCISAARFYRLWTLASAAPLHLSCSTGLARRGVVHHGDCLHPAHPYLPVAEPMW